ncbi:tyrosine-type recombinase/integrase [Quadrisphaera setariae]|uniref:Tyrosine-type recombinase/integrase n=1 Tax=Quadrisphaera setariae TaxID=2593304 RepID=A0A5C8ZEK2_9ACTN|nr:tyrosine-type recombinase/integrase [Quadrisphaera setariae]TXR56247.1 tyrosine-type recombinase/integrase [Quadrisphaera setariae]
MGAGVHGGDRAQVDDHRTHRRRLRDVVFVREDGSVLHPEHVTRRFQRQTNVAGLEKIRFQDLRHTRATRALLAGVPLKVVQERLGHSSYTPTANTYTHVQPEAGVGAAARIASLTLSRPA